MEKNYCFQRSEVVREWMIDLVCSVKRGRRKRVSE